VLVSAESSAVRFVQRGTGDTIRVAMRDVAGLEVSRGRGSRVGRGAALGLGIGAVAGAVTGGVAYLVERNTCACPPFSEYVAFTAVAGIFVGTSVGTVVGAFIRGERWTPVPLPVAASAGR
jgi:hypothetical protein